MKKKRNPRTKSILIFTFCLLFAWTTFGHTTDEIQLRKYPKSDGQVLDTIPRDRKFKIVEKFGSWRYILVEGSTYGGGWVDSKELEVQRSTKPKENASARAKEISRRKAAAPEKTEATAKNLSPKSKKSVKGKNNPKPPAHGKVSLATVKIHPLPPTVDTRETEPNRLQVKDLVSRNVAPDHSSKGGNRATGEDPKPAQRAIDPRRPSSHNTEPAPDAHSPARRTNGKERVNTPGKKEPLAFIQTAHADALPKTGAQPVNTQKNPQQAPISHTSERTAAPVSIDNSRNAPLNTQQPVSTPGGMRDFLNLGFRLLSVILSCLAIIFAYKAKKMAAMSYHLVVQLQQNLELGRRREFDERY